MIDLKPIQDFIKAQNLLRKYDINLHIEAKNLIEGISSENFSEISLLDKQKLNLQIHIIWT